MTRKHFRAIASALKESNASNATIEAIVAKLWGFNDRFDAGRFRVAARNES
jgi:hypothetical protein